MTDTIYCGRCGHPSFTHTDRGCTAVDPMNGGSGDVIEAPCDCARPYDRVAGAR